MPDIATVYTSHADQYARLVEREDYQGNIARALNQIRPLDGLDVVELGAGTGRLTALLAPVARSIQVFDASQHMLDVAIAMLERSGLHNWQATVADHRNLPIAEQVADIAVAGWTICYTALWHPAAWREELGRALAEMRRVLRPGSTIIILETLGTGYETPHPPDDMLAYYAALEQAGFASTWIRTDYRFESQAEAAELIGFFFGDPLAARVEAERAQIVPECTGIWWLTL